MPAPVDSEDETEDDETTALLLHDRDVRCCKVSTTKFYAVDWKHDATVTEWTGLTNSLCANWDHLC